MTPWLHRALIVIGLAVSVVVGWTAARWYPFLDDVMCGLNPCTGAELAAGRRDAWLAMIPGAVVLALGIVLQFVAARPTRRTGLGITLGVALALAGPFALAIGAFGGDNLLTAVAVAFVIGVAASVSFGTGPVRRARTDLAVAYLCAVLPLVLLAGAPFLPFDGLKRWLSSAWLVLPLLVVAGAWGLGWAYRRWGGTSAS